MGDVEGGSMRTSCKKITGRNSLGSLTCLSAWGGTGVA